MIKKTQFVIVMMFAFLFLQLSACKDDSGAPKNGNFFYGVLDGKEILFDGLTGQGSGLSSCGSAGVNTYFNGGFWVEGEGAQVTLAANSIEPYPDSDFFYEMFKEGTHSYNSIVACAFDLTKVGIAFADDTGDYWSSVNDQANASFVITKRGKSDGLEATIEGTFECDVESSNTNEVKRIRSGEFRFVLGLF